MLLHSKNLLYRISVYVTIDPEYGFVNTIRIFKKCGAEKLKSDSITLTIHAEFSGSYEQLSKFLDCIAEIRGSCGAELRALLKLADSSKLIKCGFVRGPRQLFGKNIFYRGIQEGFLVIEPTKKEQLYVARLYHVKRLLPPLQPSMYMVYGILSEVTIKVKDYMEVLARELNSLQKCIELQANVKLSSTTT
ncbi:MAG: hypothetical protein DRO12_00655 [Thermoprotei archaeon]|nr:MAG: hypothetical protein DRO12_00655 [Thermoprotei archaeon]